MQKVVAQFDSEAEQRQAANQALEAKLNQLRTILVSRFANVSIRMQSSVSSHDCFLPLGI